MFCALGFPFGAQATLYPQLGPPNVHWRPLHLAGLHEPQPETNMAGSVRFETPTRGLPRLVRRARRREGAHIGTRQPSGAGTKISSKVGLNDLFGCK